jgi:hypothetical protein
MVLMLGYFITLPAWIWAARDGFSAFRIVFMPAGGYFKFRWLTRRIMNFDHDLYVGSIPAQPGHFFTSEKTFCFKNIWHNQLSLMIKKYLLSY